MKLKIFRRKNENTADEPLSPDPSTSVERDNLHQSSFAQNTETTKDATTSNSIRAIKEETDESISTIKQYSIEEASIQQSTSRLTADVPQAETVAKSANAIQSNDKRDSVTKGTTTDIIKIEEATEPVIVQDNDNAEPTVQDNLLTQAIIESEPIPESSDKSNNDKDNIIAAIPGQIEIKEESTSEPIVHDVERLIDIQPPASYENTEYYTIIQSFLVSETSSLNEPQTCRVPANSAITESSADEKDKVPSMLTTQVEPESNTSDHLNTIKLLTTAGNIEDAPGGFGSKG
ncbi:hypothetical protein BDF19DRAFT_422256 [Syncephalis fuscata]|nr:hypothetical protein BDF19DRAFT_422256 [Syncephalis fuscata]